MLVEMERREVKCCVLLLRIACPDLPEKAGIARASTIRRGALLGNAVRYVRPRSGTGSGGATSFATIPSSYAVRKGDPRQ